jgi:lipopolysaccharide transport system ATP-binding protein
MSDIAISVQNLSKRYRIGKSESQTTKRRSITRWIASPFYYLYSTLRQPDPDEAIWALKDVSFEVKHGEVLGVIGRNGAGKTTLLKILSRITEPTSGRAILNGRVGSLLEVGTGFHPELTGRENIYLSGAILGMKKTEIDHKFDEIVDFSGVEKFIDTPVKRYSSGMRVRLAFAVAAHLEPEILLIDEVLAVGDASFQKKCLGKMGDVAQEGRTILFVSHNMAAIQRLCSYCLALNNGKISLQGKTSDVVQTYLAATSGSTSLERNIKLTKRKYSNTGEKFRLTYIKLRPPGEKLTPRDPLKLKLCFEAIDFVEEVVIGIGVNSFEGVRLLTCESEDVGKIWSLAPGTQGTVEIEIPNPSLAPGRYTLDIGARSGGNLALDSVHQVIEFEISSDESNLLLAQRRGLGLRPVSRWKELNPRPFHEERKVE